MFRSIVKYNLIFLFTYCHLPVSAQAYKFEILGDTPYHYILYSVLVFSIFYFLVTSQTKSLIKTRKLLKEKEQALSQIESQRAELELINKNMTDSLNYALKIQEALFPSEEYLKKHFIDSFILLMPKSIVSGDFYWVERKGDKIFIVAADCTGHGVPGALMSIIGLEILNKAINEENHEQPAMILEMLNKGLEKVFSREKNVGTVIKDGMDIGLCVIDKKRKKLEYSGAIFPLYIIRKNNLMELKGDKLMIGMNPPGASYTNHIMDLMENDKVYMFSDGYADQFGGIDNKKFMYRRFRYLLLTIHGFPMNDQKAILEENIRSWMGNSNQIDDIMVIGFRPI